MENELNIPFQQVDVDKILLVEDPDPKSNRMFIKYKMDKGGAADLNIQTPKMKIPFGVSDDEKYAKMNNNANARVKYYLEMSFFGENDNSKVNLEADKLKAFRAKMKAIDERIISLLLQQKVLDKFAPNEYGWDQQAIARSLNKAVRVYRQSKASKAKGETKTYPDSFRVPIPWSYDKNNAADKGEVAKYVCFWNEEKPPKQITIDSVVNNCYGRALVRFQSLTIMPGTGAVHYSKKLRQLQVFAPRERLTGGFNFHSDDESDKNSDSEDLLIEDPEEVEEEEQEEIVEDTAEVNSDKATTEGQPLSDNDDFE